MIMKGGKLLNQVFHPCFIYNRYFHVCQEQAASRLSFRLFFFILEAVLHT